MVVQVWWIFVETYKLVTWNEEYKQFMLMALSVNWIYHTKGLLYIDRRFIIDLFTDTAAILN